MLTVCITLLANALQAQEPIPFDSIPAWIEQHVELPPRGAVYGTEQCPISATWDGRVFLVARPYTLDPACERAIIEAVKAAPRCYLTGSAAEDIYRDITIDFARGDDRSVGLHSAPFFINTTPHWRYKGREALVRWTEDRFQVPKSLEASTFTDTLTVRYRINSGGRMTGIRISDSAVPEVAASLRKLLRSSPRWHPALAQNRQPIDITLEDRWIVRVENNKPQIELWVDPIYRNTAPAPEDPSVIVINPEVAATCQAGKFPKLLFEQLPATETTIVRCRFVVERDGTVGKIEIEAPNEEIGRQAVALIRGAQWQPATQQGTPVRSLYDCTATRRPVKAHRPTPQTDSGRNFVSPQTQPQADFGRDFIYLLTPPHLRNRVYLQSDGTYATFPFDDQGRFNHAEYQKQQMRSAKQSPTRNRNFRKSYERQLKKRYVEK